MASKINPIAPYKVYFTDTAFHNLMKKRIYHVLLISSAYDAFMLEMTGASTSRYSTGQWPSACGTATVIQVHTEMEAFECWKRKRWTTSLQC